MSSLEPERPCPDDVPDRFGPIALIYDFVEVPFRFFRVNPREAIAGAVPAGASAILDLGTGTGSVLAAVARRHPDAALAGLDASLRMLRVAGGKLGRMKARGVARGEVRLVCGDAAELPFEDGSFDVVTASLFFHELPPGVRARAFDEAVRVLAPGGALVVLDLDKRPAGWRAPAQWLLELFEEDYAWQLSGTGLSDELAARGLIVGEPDRRMPFVQLAKGRKKD